MGQSGVPADHRIVVIGSGRMARGIAAALIGTHFSVAMVSRSLSRARVAARDVARRAGSDNSPDAHKMAAEAFLDADVVIESVIENEDAKRRVLAQSEEWVVENALIATNTSSISVESLAERMERPDRFFGLHFLNPADLTAVVEVAPTSSTSSASLDRAVRLVRRLGKDPLVVRGDVPGFIWNRLQFALIREALWLLENGVADSDAIDRAVTHGLAPRWLAAGPLATVDLGGPAVFRAAAENLFPELADGAGTIERLRAAEAGTPLRRWEPDELAAVAARRDRWLTGWRKLTSEV